MNGAPGMRTPGSWADVAHPFAICQWTRNGVVMTSRRNPSPGMMPVKAQGCGSMYTNSISSRSPGMAPLTKTGPVSGWTAPSGTVAKSASVEFAFRWPSRASRVSSATCSPGSTSSFGSTAGCHRL